MTASGSRTISRGPAPAFERSALPAGFYHLTLVATVVLAVDVRVRPVAGLPSISLLGLLIYPLLLAVLAEIMARPGLAARLSVYRHNRPLAWYVGYAGIASLIGLARSSDSLQAFYDLGTAFGLYVLVLITVDTRARLLTLLTANLAAALPGLALSVLQIVTGSFRFFAHTYASEAKLDLSGEGVENAPTGLMAHPNGLALSLLPIAIFVAVAAWRGFGTRRRSSVALGAVLVVTLLVVRMTYAKGVYAWLATAMVFLVLPRVLDRWRFWIALLTPFAGITILVWLAMDLLLQGDQQYGTVLARMELWLSALDILQSDRFVTVFGNGGLQLLSRGMVSFEYPNPHNAWLSQALTYGVPALVFYVAAFAGAMRSLARRMRSCDGATHALALAAMASLMALLGENFFEPADRGITFQAQLFLVFAVAARVVDPGTRRAELTPTASRA